MFALELFGKLISTQALLCYLTLQLLRLMLAGPLFRLHLLKPSVQPLSPPKKFNPQPYVSIAGVDPFSTQKLSVAIKQEARQPNSLLAAEINRRKEPLEAYPMDSMTMVGSVVKHGQPYALLKVDNLLYQVKVGDYLGQNYGKITKITETGIAVREIVQDAAGEWIERPGALQLQEKAR